jgi:hypothetical protein
VHAEVVDGSRGLAEWALAVEADGGCRVGCMVGQAEALGAALATEGSRLICRSSASLAFSLSM